MKAGRRHIGSVVAPPRFLIFMAIALVAAPVGIALLGWREGVMVGFDLAAATFLLICWPLLHAEADAMRRAACRNDANRVLLLGVSAVVVLTVLTAIASELMQKGSPKPFALSLVVATLALSWIFSNITYALHYAHLYYGDEDGSAGDDGGLDFPKTREPDYWDFIYFAFCLGMCFQTSDVDMTSGRMRRTATAHCLLAFVFNLGVVAFSINVLGGN